MPRNARCVEPGYPYHITQRGTDRQNVFFSAQDRQCYLGLLGANLADTGVRIRAYCLMRNHVHLVVVPDLEDSLGILFRRVHGEYAMYLNARRHRTGHLWQNRFFSCPLGQTHQWTAIRYVEANPVRARLVDRPEEYRWSSGPAHLGVTGDDAGVLDRWFWEQSGGVERWRDLHCGPARPREDHLLHRCTYSGRPFGDEALVEHFEQQFQRKWRRWAFEKTAVAAA